MIGEQNFIGISAHEKSNYIDVVREDNRVIYNGICGELSNKISLSQLITVKQNLWEYPSVRSEPAYSYKCFASAAHYLLFILIFASRVISRNSYFFNHADMKYMKQY